MHPASFASLTRIKQLFPSFSSIPEEEWGTTEVIHVTPTTTHHIQEGHLLQHAMFILSGSIRIYRISRSGREVTLYRVRAGQCCTIMMASILGGLPYEASVSIESPTEVLLLPVPLFRTWVDRYQTLKDFIYGEMVRRMTDVSRQVEEIAYRPMLYRIADVLLTRSKEAASATVTITHEELAVDLGTAREVVSRTLKELANRQAIRLGRRRIEILRAEVLHALLEQEDAL